MGYLAFVTGQSSSSAFDQLLARARNDLALPVARV